MKSISKTLLPHITVALLLQFSDVTNSGGSGGGGSGGRAPQQPSLPHGAASELFGSAHELFFAATVLNDPLFTQEQSSCPLNLALLSSYLERDYSVLQNGNNVVIFLDGPLGMLLSHKPTIGLMVNSFQGVNGQGEFCYSRFLSE